MPGLDHRRLRVYDDALRLVELCDVVAAELGPGQAHVRNQLDRAATSVVANIAEGAGEFAGAEKARFYRMARRSAIEVAAWLDIMRVRGGARDSVDAASLQVERVVASLVRLIRRYER